MSDAGQPEERAERRAPTPGPGGPGDAPTPERTRQASEASEASGGPEAPETGTEETMQRGSDRLGPRRDEEMKHELEGRLRSGHGTRAEEWHDPEPDAEDDPQVPAGRAPGDENQALRSDLARYLGRTPFPARRADLLRTLGERHAPDPLVDQVRELPPRDTYRNVQDVMVALGRPPAE